MFIFMTALMAQAQVVDSATFKWADGASADMAYTITGSRDQSAGAYDFARSATYSMSAASADGSVIITRTDPKTTSSMTKPALRGLELQNWIDDLVTIVPSFTVTNSGVFSAVGGVTEVEASGKLLLSGAGIPTEVQSQFAGIFSDTALYGLMGDHWTWAVSWWRGQPIINEKEFGHTTTVPMPLLGGKIDMIMSAKMTTNVSCNGGVTETHCVKINATSKPNEEQINALLQGHPNLSEVVSLAEVTLVTDPKGLIPYSLTIRRLSKLKTTQGVVDKEDITRNWTWLWK